MSNHQNLYSQRGCIGCKPCEGGGANIGRTWTIVALGVLTSGLGLIILPFFKKCQYCGHNAFMNKHFGPDTRNQAPAQQQPTIVINNAPADYQANNTV